MVRFWGSKIRYKIKGKLDIYLYYYIKHLRIEGFIFCHDIFYYTHFIPQLDGCYLFLIDETYVIASIDPLFLSISFPYILLFP
jgi:hypothetical protein